MKQDYGVLISYEAPIDQPQGDGTAELSGSLGCVVNASDAEDAVKLAKAYLESYVKIKAYSLTSISVREP